jgi:hypothetical protein
MSIQQKTPLSLHTFTSIKFIVKEVVVSSIWIEPN